ncbi:MAG: hypothetical protein GPJ54_07835 [Candidatus Heimdallarchaeota archaeon]|nr:hypothetical protein [Candidatus Heimdallarchaeota archaeon]
MQKYLILMSSSGIPMFSVSYSCGYGIQCDDITDPLLENPTLFSAFLGGLFGISSELGGKLEHISISNLDIFAYSQPNLIAVLITEPTANIEEQDNYKNKTRVISELFNQTYEFYLKKNKVHDIGVFNGFQKILEDAGLADEGSNFKKNCQECVFDKACPYRIITGDPSLSITEKLARIPKQGIFSKMKQAFKAMKIYRPITDENKQTLQNSVLTLSIYNKNTKNPTSIGFGCDSIQFYELDSFENEFIKGEIKNLLTSSPDDTEIIIKFSPFHKRVAYGVLNSQDYAIIVQFEYSDKDRTQFILKDILYKIESIIKMFDDEKADFMQLQVIEEDQPISFCIGCLDDIEKSCFSKSVLEQLIASK